MGIEAVIDVLDGQTLLKMLMKVLTLWVVSIYGIYGGLSIYGRPETRAVGHRC